MKDITKFKFSKPLAAEGKICIELTDPLTGKVKERVTGKNHIFNDFIFSQMCQDSTMNTWVASLGSAGTHLVLTDSSADIDDSVPFVLGNLIGYGVPGNGSSGLYMGAYNAANQILGLPSGNSLRWKFQYDFTTVQAIGTINTIGLTNQFYTYGRILSGAYPYIANTQRANCYTCDGRYEYYITTSGVVTKIDMLTANYSTIDISSIVGTNASDTKWIAYDPSTGCYYVFIHSGTVANRKLYKFLNSEFTTLLATYSVSNITKPNPYACPMFVYGNTMFLFYGNAVYKADFINNVNFIAQTITAKPPNIQTSYSYQLQVNTVPFNSKHVVSFGEQYQSQLGLIYDLSTQSAVGNIIEPWTYSNSPVGAVLHPGTNIPCVVANYNRASLVASSAIAAKKLDTPVVKTSANGMTVTYELEVSYG